MGVAAAGTSALIGSLGSAGITAAGGIGSTIGNSVNSKKVAQMNNEFNERMLNKQMDYNTSMYERQLGDQWAFYNDAKEYNSASAQAQRLRQAGINPGLVMSGQNSGTVSSMTSPSAQGINPPTGANTPVDFSGIGNAVNNAVQSYIAVNRNKAEINDINASAKQKELENMTTVTEALARIAKIRAETKNTRVKTQLDELLKTYQDTFYQNEVTMQGLQIESIKQDIQTKTYQNIMMDAQAKAFPEQLRLQMAESSARIGLLKQQGKLTFRQMVNEIHKEAQIIAQTEYTKSQTAYTDQQTVNAMAENTGIHYRNDAQLLQNRFQSETFKNRVKQVEAVLMRAVNNAGIDGLSGVLNLVDQGFNKKRYRSLMP